MRVAFHTLGCKVNQCETETLAESFERRRHEIVSADGFADVYIINTCTVTGLADRKSRQCIRRCKKLNPEAIVAVTGCYAQINPGEISCISGVDIVCGNNDKTNLPQQIEEHLAGSVCISRDVPTKTSDTGSRTRAFIKIQDGCDRFCSYCIVPYARCVLSSKPLFNVLREAEVMIDAGRKEIVLAGINTALYKTTEGYDIEDIIRELSGLKGDFRIRLSSLEPTVIDVDFVKKLLKYEKLCRHMHLSLQSGSDNTLKLMNRRYNISDYMEIVTALRGFDADYGISTDMIVGFPGEVEDDFNKSLEIVETVGFCKVHVFKFSGRKGTDAFGMDGQIDGKEKSRRSALMIVGAEQSARRFFGDNLGKRRRVLIEEYIEKSGTFTGFTENYIRVYIDRSSAYSVDLNAFVDVKLKGLYKDGVKGEIESG